MKMQPKGQRKVGRPAAAIKPAAATAMKRPAACSVVVLPPCKKPRTIVLGCCKCRFSKIGCTQCRNPAFSGKRGGKPYVKTKAKK